MLCKLASRLLALSLSQGRNHKILNFQSFLIKKRQIKKEWVKICWDIL